MVTCPRCQQPVDETVRTSCPLCFTPIPQTTVASGPLAGHLTDPASPAAPSLDYQLPGVSPTASPPQPNYMQPSPPPPGSLPMPAAPRPLMNPGSRVSLTGEVIDSGAPQAPPPSYVGGAGPAMSAPRPTAPGAPARNTISARRPQETAPARSGASPVVGIVIAIVVILGGGVGGWYFWMHRTNPKDQALAVMKAYLTQDYRTAYSLTAFSPEASKKFPTPDAYAAAQSSGADNVISSNPMLKPMKSAIEESLKTAAGTATVAEATVTGDKADVPTSFQISFAGQSLSMKGTAHMINEMGVWKLDQTADQGGGGRATIDMLGRPDIGGRGGR